VYRPGGVGTSGSVADKVYKTTELVGTSSEGIDDAIRGAITRASKTLRGMDWFTVEEIRGHIETDRIGHVQVTLKVGFALEDE
jgi:flavin-binding protein dodecin